MGPGDWTDHGIDSSCLFLRKKGQTIKVLMVPKESEAKFKESESKVNRPSAVSLKSNDLPYLSLY